MEPLINQGKFPRNITARQTQLASVQGARLLHNCNREAENQSYVIELFDKNINKLTLNYTATPGTGTTLTTAATIQAVGI